MEQQVQVDPDVLGRVAGDVATLREDLQEAGREIDAVSTEVGKRLAGWRLARVGEDTMFAWRGDAKRVGDRLEDYAGALERCARDYRYADRISARTFELFPGRGEARW